MENSITLTRFLAVTPLLIWKICPYSLLKSGSKYQFDFSVIDPDNDSVSFVLAHAYQDKMLKLSILKLHPNTMPPG
jgi:hypothetical protein